MLTQTQIDAYHTILESGYLGDNQRMVFEFLSRFGPCTGGELARRMMDERVPLGGGRGGPGNVVARLGELSKMNCVDKLPKRTCTVTGKEVTVWACNSNPILQPKKSLKRRLADLGFKSIEEYEASPLWINFRNGYWTRHRKFCALTGDPADHLHHISYDNIGAELDSDVLPLTEEMHALIHFMMKEHDIELSRAHVVIRDTISALKEQHRRMCAVAS